MQLVDILGKKIGTTPDEAFESKVVTDLSKDRVRIDDIASILQAGLQLLYHEDRFWEYSNTGVWIPIKDFQTNNRIADFLKEHNPRKCNSATIGDIRCRLYDRVRESNSVGQNRHECEYINFKNGLYHIPSGGLFSHVREALTFYQFPIEFDRNASCPQWERFIDHISGSDRSIAALIQNYVGYVMSGLTSLQSFMWLYGIPGGGKSIFAQTIVRLIGPDRTAILDFDSADNFLLSSIVGKKFILIDEFDDHRLTPRLTKTIKSLAGFGWARVNRKHVDAINHQNTAKMMICSNSLPLIHDASNGIFRRLIPINLQRPISEECKKKWIADTNAFESEMPGIVRWALAGLDNVRKQDTSALELTDKALIWLEEAKADANQIIRWSEEHCAFDANKFTTTDSLFESYLRWFDQERMSSSYRLSKNTFAKKLKQSFPGKIESHTNGDQRGFKGVCIRPKHVNVKGLNK